MKWWRQGVCSRDYIKLHSTKRLTVHKYLKVVSEIRKFQKIVNTMIRVYKTGKCI